MSEPDSPMPTDLVAYRDLYAGMFGAVPLEVTERFEIVGAIDPDLLRLIEQLSAHVLYSDLLEPRTIGLLGWAGLLALGRETARVHAAAARRAGATWEELHLVAELLCVLTGGLSVLDRGSAILARLREEEGERLAAHRASPIARAPP